MRSKEYHLIKQGLCELKVDKKKKSKVEIAYIVVVGSFNTPNPYLLPLSSSFNFNLSFLILLNVISNNIPVPVLKVGLCSLYAARATNLLTRAEPMQRHILNWGREVVAVFQKSSENSILKG